MAYREHSLDGARILFDRTRGLNVLQRGLPSVRQAPRVLQIGLLTPCNLSCSFCYRDQEAPSRLTAHFLLDLLGGAADWGVLEVAFGGGEPLLFKDFPELVRRLHETTPLGINFTTNGTLLTPEVVDRLRGAVGEIRVSAYADNHYRRTLRMLQGESVGVNWLVTPENVGRIEPTVRDFFDLGARNVLLLGYKGADPALQLGDRDLDRLRDAVGRLQPLPLRLDICWYPRLPDLPHLFSRADCGAGDDFLVITPDRAVQPCSFHHERIPFETLDDLKRIYMDLRTRKPAADVGGCTRKQFAPTETAPRGPMADLYAWSAHSSNNSGDWTIVGEFKSPEQARKAAEALRELARAHEAYLASREGQEWLEKNEFNGGIPTPPLHAFGEAHGFKWDEEGEGLWWEEDGCGAPVLTAGAVGNSVVVYHPYCMGLPEKPFTEYFRQVGAKAFGYWQYERPMVVADARGTNRTAIEALRDHLAAINQTDSRRAGTTPPWGEKVVDPRIEEDEDAGAGLNGDQNEIIESRDHLTLHLSFENTFAGSVALERWLKDSGFTEITLRIEAQLTPLKPPVQTVEPKRGILPRSESPTKRLVNLSPEQIVNEVFDYAELPEGLGKAFDAIPITDKLRLCRERWRRERGRSDIHTWATIRLMERLGRDAEPWTREWVERLNVEKTIPFPRALGGLAATLPKEDALSICLDWLKGIRKEEDWRNYVLAMGSLKHPRVLALIEEDWEGASPSRPIESEWISLAADSGLTWARALAWIQSGRPLSLIAIEALRLYDESHLPADFGKPSRAELVAVLDDLLKKDSAPRMEIAINGLKAAGRHLTSD